MLARHVDSPADLERRNPNLVGGDSLAGSHHLSQNFMFRPIPGWARWKTPVRDLYMIGASTWPGAGTGAGSGYMLAKMLAPVDDERSFFQREKVAARRPDERVASEGTSGTSATFAHRVAFGDAGSPLRGAATAVAFRLTRDPANL